MSPVLTVISAHLDAVAPNFLIQERLHLNDWRNDIITNPLQAKDGFSGSAGQTRLGDRA